MVLVTLPIGKGDNIMSNINLLFTYPMTEGSMDYQILISKSISDIYDLTNRGLR
jgi:hypothetical protein